MNLLRSNFLSLIAFCGLFLASSTSFAALEIEISGGSAQQIPIAIVPFGGTDTKENIGEIVAADLKRSGLFRVLETRGMANLPTTAAQIKYAEWVALQAQAVTVGNVEAAGNRLKVSFQLMDALKQTQLAGMDYQIAPSQARATAHKIADIIYQKLTGQPGAFASRIAYITKTGKRYALQVADADGFNPQTVVSSNARWQ
jgi:TolB protein